MKLPIIHLNGSNKERLLESATEAMEAVRVAIEKVCLAAPHGRDYYPYDKPGERPAIFVAQDEHAAIVSKLRAVHQELEAFAIGINEGGGQT